MRTTSDPQLDADADLPLLVRGACPHDCPDTCAWTVGVRDGVAVELRGDPDHPFTGGGLCAKVNHYLEDRVYNPDRLLYPLRRAGPKGSGELERVSWDEALEDIAARLKGIVAEDGAEAILPYSYMGTQGMVQGMAMDGRFFARLEASRLERTICGDNGQAGVAATIGIDAGIDPEDIQHARLIIIWGTNTVVTNLHLWPFVQRARRAGAEVIVIDPVRTRTAQAADRHMQPMPGTDAALALGMMHVIVAEDLYDHDYVERHTLGFDKLSDRLQDYPPKRAAEITRLSVEEIVDLARRYATVRPAAIRTLVGMEHRRNGAMTFRTVACLPALVGAWRDRGGGLVAMTGRHVRNAVPMQRLWMPELEDPAKRLINMLELGRALTDPSLRPPIRALVVYNSNPAAIAPNQNLVLEGLARDDLFAVVHEQFMTDTARYADYVLPATTQAEHWDLMYTWGHLYLSLNRPAIEPRGEAVPNSELFRRLARAMGMDHLELQESDEEIIRRVLDADHPWLEGITFERLLEEGWAKLRVPEDWRPFADGNFPTPSGKCELYSERLAELGFDPLPAFEPAPESPAGDPELAARYPLALVAAKTGLHFLNSSYGGIERHLKGEREPLLEIHPDDAQARGIRDGDMVRVFNERGEVEVRARVGDRVRPGVVSIPSGWWASRSPGGRSANALTADGVAPWGRGGDFHDTLVEVTR
ncbi:MAG: molybdopterin-containing oxidoreductase family protein [Actinomycetota bacterium]